MTDFHIPGEPEVTRDPNGRAYNGHASEPQGAPLPPLKVRSMAALEGLPVPAIRYIVQSWIPLRKPVLLSGCGGGGKTTLLCQLGGALAIGGQFLGIPVERRGTLALLCEDDDDDTHRALAKIAAHFGRPLSEFTGFNYFARAGLDNVLVARNRNGDVLPTPFYGQVQQAIGDLKPAVLMLDNSRHVASINENDGSEVTRAWNLLHALMQSSSGTTLLAGHVPKNGSAEFAGNAAWENVARSRLFLGPVKADPDGEPVENDPRRGLRRGKSNADGTSSLEIVWDQGAFRLPHPDATTFGDRLDRGMRERQAAQAFLDALDTFTGQQRAVSHKIGTNYAPKLIVDAGLAGGFDKKALARGMELLFRENRIIADQKLWRGTDRHAVVGLARCEVAHGAGT